MEKLKIKVDGIDKTIEYTDRFSKGLFLVWENKPVLKNCKILNINLPVPTDELELHQRFTKLGRLCILTIRLLNNHFQYIIMDYAEPDAFNDLLQQAHPGNKEALLTAYNMTKIRTLGDIDLLGKAFGDEN